MISDTITAILFSAGFLGLHFLLPKGTDARKLAAWASLLMAFIVMFEMVSWVLFHVIRFFFL